MEWLLLPALCITVLSGKLKLQLRFRWCSSTLSDFHGLSVTPLFDSRVLSVTRTLLIFLSTLVCFYVTLVLSRRLSEDFGNSRSYSQTFDDVGRVLLTFGVSCRLSYPGSITCSKFSWEAFGLLGLKKQRILVELRWHEHGQKIHHSALSCICFNAHQRVKSLFFSFCCRAAEEMALLQEEMVQ